jgi:hypothetical protein
MRNVLEESPHPTLYAEFLHVFNIKKLTVPMIFVIK